MKNLRKWEEEYMQYKMGTRQKEMKEIQDKLNNKSASKEEYDKLMKMKKVEANIDKVTNILELKNSISEQIKEIEEELIRRQGSKEKTSEQNKQDEAIYKEAQAISLELASIEADKEKVKAELKNKNLSAEERENLNKKLVELDNKLQENNSKYTKNFEAIQNIETRKPESKPVMKTNKFSSLSNEELDKKKFDLSTKISKCNMVAGNLMKGMNWDSIDIKLEKWQDKKYVPKDGKPLTEKPIITLGKKDLETKKEENVIEKSENKELVKPNKIMMWMQENKDKHRFTYNFLNKFYNEEKYPRMYNLINKITNTKEPEEVKKEEKVVEVAQKVQEQPFKEKRDDFDKYLKEVANKGLKTIQQEKLSQAREQAKAREEQKFNKTAGTKTVTQEEEQDEEMEQE